MVGLLGLVSVANSSSNYDPQEVYDAMYRSYFDSLQLQYEFPAGCAGGFTTASWSDNGGQYGKPICALAADFNGDGNADYAALLEYIGAGGRTLNRYLDLIVLYSSNDRGETHHQIFRNMGAVADRGVVDTFLSIQPTGEIELPTYVKHLDKPGINLLSTTGENDDKWAFPTIYWDSRLQTFYSLTKDDD